MATEEKIDDVLTKPPSRVKLEYFREKLGVIEIESHQKRETCLLG